jgi:hypothetical protein
MTECAQLLPKIKHTQRAAAGKNLGANIKVNCQVNGAPCDVSMEDMVARVLEKKLYSFTLLWLWKFLLMLGLL